MKPVVGLLAAGVLSIGLGGCVTDGYGYGSDYGYGYGPYVPAPIYGAAPAYRYGSDVYGRTCVRRERIWDPYAQRTVVVRRTYAC
jgi:hypothetical protein